MISGTVKTTVNVGYGFISADGLDYFFHRSDLAEGTEFGDLREDDPVRFDVLSPQPVKGPRATNVKLLTATPEAVA